MQNAQDATTGARTGGGGTATRERAALLTVDDVAVLLSCSRRTVYRLADSGRMPGPVKLGALVRWSRKDVKQWIDDGCPPRGQEGGDHAQ